MTEITRIQNIQNYIIEYINGDLILTPKQQPIYITDDELKKMVVTWSTILECNINNVEGVSISSGKTKYHPILLDIIKTFKQERKIMIEMIKKIKFNFKPTNEHGVNGYYWDDDLKLSIQHKCANATFKGIIRMVKIKKYTIKISIKLKTNDKIIHFKN